MHFYLDFEVNQHLNIFSWCSVLPIRGPIEQSSHKWGNAWLTGLFKSWLRGFPVIRIVSLLISTLAYSLLQVSSYLLKGSLMPYTMSICTNGQAEWSIGVAKNSAPKGMEMMLTGQRKEWRDENKSFHCQPYCKCCPRDKCWHWLFFPVEN